MPGSSPFSGEQPAGAWSSCPEFSAELGLVLRWPGSPPSPVIDHHSLGIYLDALSSFLGYQPAQCAGIRFRQLSQSWGQGQAPSSVLNALKP